MSAANGGPGSLLLDVVGEGLSQLQVAVLMLRKTHTGVRRGHTSCGQGTCAAPSQGPHCTQ